MNPDHITLGMTATDSVTDITGTVTIICTYLHGSPRGCLEYVNGRGERTELWCDLARLNPGAPPF